MATYTFNDGASNGSGFDNGTFSECKLNGSIFNISASKCPLSRAALVGVFVEVTVCSSHERSMGQLICS